MDAPAGAEMLARRCWHGNAGTVSAGRFGACDRTLTLRARRDGAEIGDGLVFADDGAGNTIWIAGSGRVLTIDHNSNGQVRELAPSFRALLEESVQEA
ncbi:hypothetical protein FM113_16995 [Leucobacter sp. 7(1)]|nr:hypothetical protein FM113_16995 [Leucobacter sp. 7(1)]